jgi:hypothetical protein
MNDGYNDGSSTYLPAGSSNITWVTGPPLYDFIVVDSKLFRINRTTGEAWRLTNYDEWLWIKEKGE